MVNVCIQKDMFPAGESLFDILAMRMATVNWSEASAPAAKTDSVKARQVQNLLMHFYVAGHLPKNRGGARHCRDGPVNAGQKVDGCRH